MERKKEGANLARLLVLEEGAFVPRLLLRELLNSERVASHALHAEADTRSSRVSASLTRRTAPQHSGWRVSEAERERSSLTICWSESPVSLR